MRMQLVVVLSWAIAILGNAAVARSAIGRFADSSSQTL